MFLCEIDNLLRLPRSDEITRVLFAMKHKRSFNHWNTQRVHQLFQFGQQARRLRLLTGIRISAHEQRPLHHLVLSFDLKHPVAI